MRRIVRLPSGRPIPLGLYIRVWKQVLNVRPDTLITDWDCFPTEARDVLHQLRRGMQDRINRHIPGYGVGRKWSSEWWWEACCTARMVNTSGLIVRWASRDLRARLAHRIHEED